MSCTNKDFRIPDHKKGTTWDGISFRSTELDESNVEQPVDYTGSVIVAHFKKGKTGSVAFEFKTSDQTIVFGTGITSDPTTGEILIKPTLINYPAYDYYLEILEIRADGNVYPVIGDAWWKITE